MRVTSDRRPVVVLHEQVQVLVVELEDRAEVRAEARVERRRVRPRNVTLARPADFRGVPVDVTLGRDRCRHRPEHVLACAGRVVRLDRVAGRRRRRGLRRARRAPRRHRGDRGRSTGRRPATPRSCAVASSCAATWPGLQSGCCAATSAATAETIGAENDVPLAPRTSCRRGSRGCRSPAPRGSPRGRSSRSTRSRRSCPSRRPRRRPGMPPDSWGRPLPVAGGSDDDVPVGDGVARPRRRASCLGPGRRATG